MKHKVKIDSLWENEVEGKVTLGGCEMRIRREETYNDKWKEWKRPDDFDASFPLIRHACPQCW